MNLQDSQSNRNQSHELFAAPAMLEALEPRFMLAATVGPDLVIVPGTMPASIQINSDESLEVTVEVQNIGDVDATGGVEFTLHVSIDPVDPYFPPSGGLWWIDDFYTDSIAAGQSYSETITLSRLGAGTYYLHTVVDQWDDIVETDETNNWGVISDLTVLGDVSVSGYVKDDSGNALEGIQVDLYFDEDDPDWADDDAWKWYDSINTDVNGQYEFTNLPGQEYRLNIWAGQQAGGGSTNYIGDDLTHVTAVGGQASTGNDFTLLEAGLITGYVRDAQEVGVQYVEIAVETQNVHGEDVMDWYTAWTDSSGKYELYLVPSADDIYPIHLSWGNLSNSGPAFARQMAPGLYAASVGGTTGPDFIAVEGGTITGHLQTSNGDPISNFNGIEAYVATPNGVIWVWGGTDANGDFAIEGIPTGMDFVLEIEGEEWDQAYVGGTYYAMGETWFGTYNLATGETYNITNPIIVPEAVSISGYVRDVGGAPIVNAFVGATGTDINGAQIDIEAEDDEGIRTDINGYYEFSWLPAGRFSITVQADGYLLYTQSTEFDLAPGQSQTLDIDMTPTSAGATVSGSIVNFDAATAMNSSGVALPFELICYDESSGIAEGLDILAFDSNRPWTDRDLLNPNSRFTNKWDNVEDGYDDYFVTPSAAAPGTFLVDVPTGDQTLMAVRFMENGDLGWYVNFSEQATLQPLSPGEQVVGPGLTIQMGDNSVTGSVLFPEGHPGLMSEESVMIYVRPADGSGGELGIALGSPGYSGQYEINDLPDGDYTLYAVGYGLDSFSSQPFTVTAGQQEVVDIDFAPAEPVQINGTVWEDTNANGVRDSGELNLPDMTVFLDTNDDGVLDAAENFAVTDVEGNYSFDSSYDLPAGTYYVAVDPAPLPGVGQWVQTVPVGHIEVTLASGDVDFGIDFGVTWEPETILYSLTVNSGTGSGIYEGGTVVPIVADVAPLGDIFYIWTGETADIADVSAAFTTITMQAADTEITATYMPDMIPYNLTVIDGSGDGSYLEGEPVPISADFMPGMIFDVWQGDTAGIFDVSAESTTLTMPNFDATVFATYIPDMIPYTLTVNSGSGDGSYLPGEVVSIYADAPPEGMIFDVWTGDEGGINYIYDPDATITMPNSNAVITATYRDNGVGEPEYAIADYFPLKPGPYRGYLFTQTGPSPSDTANQGIVSRVEPGLANFDGVQCFDMQKIYSPNYITSAYYTLDANGLRIHGLGYDDKGDRSYTDFGSPLQLMPATFDIENTYRDSTTWSGQTEDGDLWQGNYSRTADVIGFEQITIGDYFVPVIVGDYSESITVGGQTYTALKIIFRTDATRQGDGWSQEIDETQTVYLVEGIGTILQDIEWRMRVDGGEWEDWTVRYEMVPLPDLTVRLGAGADIPSSMVPGAKVKVPVVVDNIGEGPAVGVIEVGLYASQSGRADYLLGSKMISKLNLAAGESTDLKVEFVINGAVPTGTYSLIVKVDVTDRVFESDEANNEYPIVGAPIEIVNKFGNVEGQNKKVKLTIQDAYDTPVTFSLSGSGYGEVVVDEDGQLSVILHDTDIKTSVKITTKKRANAVIKDITLDGGSLKSLKASTTDLIGNLTAADGMIGKVQLDDVFSSSIVFGVATGQVSFTFSTVADVELISNAPIKKLKVQEWVTQWQQNVNGEDVTVDEVDDQIVTPWIGSMQVSGRKAKAQNNISAAAGHFGADLVLNGQGAKKATLGKVKIAGDLYEADWDIFGDIKSLAVAGVAELMNVRTTGSMGAIKLGAVVASNFLAGIKNDVDSFASLVGDFVNTDASIKSVSIKGLKTDEDMFFFERSSFSAATIGKVSLLNLSSDGGEGGTFGFFALDDIASISHRDTTSGDKWKWSPDEGTLNIDDFLAELVTPAVANIDWQIDLD